MQLTAREDIEAPLDRVFAELSDFETVERQALRRGIEVQRVDSVAGKGPGMQWATGFTFRGKMRNADITLSEYNPPERMVFTSVSGGLELETVIDLVALSRTRTRVAVASEFKPKTLSARLLVQSLKLAKGGVDKRFRNRMAGLAKDLEDKLKRQA